jgi:hypothetical protein
MKLNERRQLLVKKNTEALLEASREVGLEVNTEKIKYVVVSRHQNVGQNCNVLIANKSFENVANYVGIPVTNKTSFQEEIESRLNSGNASYLSVQSMSSYVLSKHIN